MTYSQQQLVCDSSTLANFKSWAQAISTFIGSCGFFTQASDSGQINWSTIAAVPGSSAFVYEIWQSNDGLATFYMKVEYGNVSGTNCPSLRLSLGTGTNGSGTLTGYFFGPYSTNGSGYTPPSTTTLYECNFFGGPGVLGIMMWRNGTNNCQQFFGVERSITTSDTYTSDYVTLYGVGNCSSDPCCQRSLVFGVGPAVLYSSGAYSSPYGPTVRQISGNGQSPALQNSIPISFPAPNVGWFGVESTVFGAAWVNDITDGVTFNLTQYGKTRTMLPAKTGPLGSVGPGNSSAALCMRIA